MALVEESEPWLDVDDETELEITGITLETTLEFASELDTEPKLELATELDLEDDTLNDDTELRLDDSELEIALGLRELVLSDELEFGIDEVVPPPPLPPPPPQAVKTTRQQTEEKRRA